MKSIFTILGLICFSSGLAQHNTTTTYHQKDGKKIQNSEEAYYKKVITVLTDEKSPVKVEEYYTSNNNLKLNGTYESSNHEFHIGKLERYYENGVLESTTKYSSQHMLIDSAHYYYPNGKLKLSFYYPYKIENEIAIATDTLILVYNDSLGKRLLTNGNGYAELGNTGDIEKGNYNNHKRIGEWSGTFFKNKYTFVENYIDGKLVSGITKDSTNQEITYHQIMQDPEYPGGIIALRQFIGKNYQYPAMAIDMGVNGEVLVSFVIEKNGTITDFRILNDLGYGTAMEALRVLKLAKQWQPGKMRGIPVRVAYKLPIRLNLK